MNKPRPGGGEAEAQKDRARPMVWPLGTDLPSCQARAKGRTTASTGVVKERIEKRLNERTKEKKSATKARTKNKLANRRKKSQGNSYGRNGILFG